MRFTLAVLALLALGASAIEVTANTNAPGFSISVTQPSEPFLRHTTVTVSWQLSGSATFNKTADYVSAWWEPFAATYVEYKNVTGNSGSVSFQLLNARYPYVFRYYRGDTLMATAANKVVPQGSYPMQVHATFVPSYPTSMNILWATNRTTGDEVVFFGLSPDNLDRRAYVKKSTTYTAEQLNEAVGLPPIARRTQPFANLGARDLRCVWGQCYNDFTAVELYVSPGMIHSAELIDLAPGQTYYFRVGEANGYQSEVKSFRSRKAIGKDSSIQILYTADAGAGYTTEGYAGSASHNAVPVPPSTAPEGAKHVWDAIKRDPKSKFDDASIVNGDISYARGWPFIWELFHNETEEIFTNAPVMASMGNHEFDYGQNPWYMCRGPDGGGEVGIPTQQRFSLPSTEEPWYWISMGPITFFSLSSEHSVDQQAEWLRNELPKVNRSETPWLVVFLHRPIHESSEIYSHRIRSLMLQEYTPLFTKFGVDMVLTGHAHYYERTCTVSCGLCQNTFRDVWTQYENVVLKNNSCTKLAKNTSKMTVDSCRVMCNNDPTCTGMVLNENNECYLTSCKQPLPLEYSRYNSVWSLERKEGRPPVYVVDGTAGGVHVPVSTPYSPLTEYKDFEKYGYSRINANGTALTWTHYHIDGSIVDKVTLKPWNV